MNTSNNLAETLLIAVVAAGVSSWLVLQLSKKNNDPASPPPPPQHPMYPFPASFLQNGHTRTPPEDLVVASPHGFSMKEALQSSTNNQTKAASKSPSDVLSNLQKGNSRFWTGKATRPEASAFERRALINQQFPSTAILGCSDSRVPVEIVFDQGLGDMFVVRVAGNCLGPTTQASLEYAVRHLAVKVLVVMGHEGCGAIRAAQLPEDQINMEPPILAGVLMDLKTSLKDVPKCQDPRAQDREAVSANVRNQIMNLCEEAPIMARVNAGELILVGGFYEISSGIVDFFCQVGGPEDRKPSEGVSSRYHPDTKEFVS